MVNVQPKNVKLVDRARRILAQAAGIPYERAAELLVEAGNSVRAQKAITDINNVLHGNPYLPETAPEIN